MKTRYVAMSLDGIAHYLLDLAAKAQAASGRSKHEQEVHAAYARGLLKAAEILKNTTIEPGDEPLTYQRYSRPTRPPATTSTPTSAS